MLLVLFLLLGETVLESSENVTDRRLVALRQICPLQEGIRAITNHEGISQQIETDNSGQVRIRITREGYITEERTINISSQ